MAEIMRPRFNVVVVLPTFEMTGAIEPIGPWLDFMNSRDKHVITVYAARVAPIGAAAPAGAGAASDAGEPRRNLSDLSARSRGARIGAHAQERAYGDCARRANRLPG